MKPGLDFIIAIQACLYAGIISIPLRLPEEAYYQFDVPVLVDVVRQFTACCILVDDGGERLMTDKLLITAIRSYKRVRPDAAATVSAQVSRISDQELTDIVNVKKAPKSHRQMDEDTHRVALKYFEQGSSEAATKVEFSNPLVLVNLSADYRYACTELSNDSLLAQCALVKESWNLQEHRPIIAWELPNSGLAFLQAAILGVFIGRRTFIMPPPPTSLLSATLYAAGTSPEATEALKQSMQKSRQ